MSGNQLYPDYVVRNMQTTGAVEYDSLFGDSSSGCSSYLDSPSSNSYTTNTTYGASTHHSIVDPNLDPYFNTNVQSPENSYSYSYAGAIADSQSIQHYSIFESINRATPYTPEEKKERIERYRSKRNLRNFNKKIKYECRKTLADSRPRVRGRFARNDEIEKATTADQYRSEDQEDDYSWITILDALNQSVML